MDRLTALMLEFDHVVPAPTPTPTHAVETRLAPMDVRPIVTAARRTGRETRAILRQLRTTDSGQYLPVALDTRRRSTRLPRPLAHNVGTGPKRLPDASLRPGRGVEADYSLDASYGQYHGERSAAFHFIQSVELARRAAKLRHRLERSARRHRSTGTAMQAGVGLYIRPVKPVLFSW